MNSQQAVKSFEQKIGRSINLEATLMKMGATLMDKDQEIKKHKEQFKKVKRLYSKIVGEMDMWKEKSVELGLENEKLKIENAYLKLNLKNQDNIHSQDRAEISEEKKYSTEYRERADKYMEENEKLKKEVVKTKGYKNHIEILKRQLYEARSNPPHPRARKFTK